MMIVERLKSLRKSNKVSQKDFARALKVSQQTVASWEVGRTEPSNVALRDIADYFNVTTDYLLGREEGEDYILSKAQLELLSDYEKLDGAGKAALKLMLDSLSVSHGRRSPKAASIIQQNNKIKNNYGVIGGGNNFNINGNICNR